MITKTQALEALDSLDDFARMTIGVDAHGPRGTLKRFIEEQAAPPAEPVAYADKIAFESAMRAGKGCDVWPKRGDGPREVVALYAAPPAAQAEPAGPGDMAVYQAMADRYAALAARGAQTGLTGDAEIECECLSAWNQQYAEHAEDTVHPMFLTAFKLGYRAALKGQPEGGAA